jgi:hypothetical protein
MKPRCPGHYADWAIPVPKKDNKYDITLIGL